MRRVHSQVDNHVNQLQTSCYIIVAMIETLKRKNKVVDIQ